MFFLLFSWFKLVYVCFFESDSDFVVEIDSELSIVHFPSLSSVYGEEGQDIRMNTDIIVKVVCDSE